MRYLVFAVGLAGALAIGIWQSQAQQPGQAPSGPGPEAGVLIKHGAYLVNEVAHCGHCHTPMDAKGKPDASRFLQGATLPFAPKEKDQEWMDEAPDITTCGLAGQWSEAEMVKFLMTGVDPKGQQPMAPMPAFHFNQGDARAVTLYLQSLPAATGQHGGK
jgi:hypothetical protein